MVTLVPFVLKSVKGFYKKVHLKYKAPLKRLTLTGWGQRPSRVCEVALQVKRLAALPEDLSLIPGAYVVEQESKHGGVGEHRRHNKLVG